MATTAQLRYSPLSSHHFTQNHRQVIAKFADNAFPYNPSVCPLRSTNNQLNSKPLFLVPGLQVCYAGDGGNSGPGGGSGHGGSGGGGGGKDSNDSKSFSDSFGPVGAFLSGWRSRVAADPQFPFKVLMEELVGVSSSVLGDMASRPNFGLNELDFVFSTLVVGSIVNFVLMYVLAPTASASSQSLPSIFANCPTSHMFETGAYGLLERLGTFVYKGTLFAAVGFAAGLVGTALSNGLIKMRKKMDPNFETPNKPPPPILNAITWAIHMGFSSNLRYQTLNGIEFMLEKGLPPVLFKSSVVVLRCVNNILGGMTFVMLARLTGSQSMGGDQGKVLTAAQDDDDDHDGSSTIVVKHRLLKEADDLHNKDAAAASK